MLGESKFEQCIRNLNYGKDDITEYTQNINELCEKMWNFEHSLKENIALCDRELNIDKKIAILDELQNLVVNYKCDLILLYEELGKYDELLSDIAEARINIPGHKDERDIVLSSEKEFVEEFEYVYNQHLLKLQTFIEDPKRVHLEDIRKAIGNEFNLQELASKVEEVSKDMKDELDVMCKKVDELSRSNKPRR